MANVAISGAGAIGGALAGTIAGRSRVREVRVIDPEGRVAEGKALDILQSSPVERFSTRVTSATTLAAAAGADVIAVADFVAGGEIARAAGLATRRPLARLQATAPPPLTGRRKP